jgi:hypothetical protein
MKESENASYNEEPDVWEYIENNPRIMGLPLSDDKAIDICSALRDIYMTLQENTEAGIELLSLLATVLVGAAEGQGNEVIEEVAVIEAMRNFDHRLRGILDEGH